MSEAVENGASPSREFHLWVGARTDTGRVRANNQDAVGTWLDLPQTIPFAESGYLFAVCDGVGGNEQGEVASALAIETLFHTYYGSDTTEIPTALKRAVRLANEAVYERGLSQSEERAMGTTLVAGVVRGATVTISNVGDSRAYLFRGRTQSTQISKDHSLVAEAVRAGQMTPQQAKESRQRNVITRALGQRQKVDVDIFEVDLMDDDVILLCSDGLHGIVEDAEMKQIAQALPPDQAANELVDLANSRNASDNVSAVIVKATRDAAPISAPVAPPMTLSETSTDRLPAVATKRGLPIAAMIAIIVVLLLIIAGIIVFFVFR
ncbi:MAG: Stp1/IreP family PP2C-type Ser/Thr phosphatase [Thermomicrobia bacterium]|nr:Stp1/IreP family PP2C-type Ser/Thr phosphatase [Thermomicrobia bacterium]